MAKARSIGSYEMTLKLSSASNGAWFPIPAVLANKIHGTATFAGTTGSMKLQGRLSSSSTAATVLITRTQAQRSAVIASTVATAVNWVRAASTKLTGGAGFVHFAIVP